MVACTYVGYSCIHICNRTLMDTSICINTSIHAECTIHRVRVSIDSSTVFYTCRSAHIGYVYVCTNLYMPTTPYACIILHLHTCTDDATHTYTHTYTPAHTFQHLHTQETELGVRVEPALYHGNLEAERDLTDVRDSAQVMVDLLERSAPGQVYNVCSNRAVKVCVCECVCVRVCARTHACVSV